jgi:hypothetical protein
MDPSWVGIAWREVPSLTVWLQTQSTIVKSCKFTLRAELIPLPFRYNPRSQFRYEGDLKNEF